MPEFLLNYNNSLVGVDKDRYLKKIELCCNTDPYMLDDTKLSKDVQLCPTVSNMDIVNYLVLTTNAVTMSQMKSYKALEAHNFFTSGWVNPNISFQELPDKNVILLGKVGHSQSLNLPPLKLWILSKPDGEIVTAHCNCMAGLGEACSHIGALLFAIEYGVSVRDAVTCTSKANKWLPPNLKQVKYAPVSEIDFSSATSKKRRLGNPQSTDQMQISRKSEIPTLSENEIAEFFVNLAAADKNSAILSLVPPYSDHFVPRKDPNLPEPLTSLYNEDSTKLTFNDLLLHSENVFATISISDSTAEIVQNATKDQANSNVWFQQRSGRITASNMHAACHTDPANPSVSLIKTICYPALTTFTTAATTWGCEHEEIGRSAYISYMNDNHESACITKTGFFINPEFPHIGASPDSMVVCNCCGVGVVEIKCPYKDRNISVNDMCRQRHSCLMENEHGQPTLKKIHTYYYQVQTQMAVCKVDYCDFIVWSSVDMHVERVEMDEVFWANILTISNNFYKVAILPELTAKWFTSLKHTVLQPSNLNKDAGKICYCNGIECQPMVTCSNVDCIYRKFHWRCLKLKAKPKAKNWLCPECKKACRISKNKEK